MRTHRIDMNLLYDHDPVSFGEHVTEIVSQLEAHTLSLFIAQLREGNVCAGEYANVTLPSRNRSSTSNVHTENESNIGANSSIGASQSNGANLESAAVSTDIGNRSKVNHACDLLYGAMRSRNGSGLITCELLTVSMYVMCVCMC